jgi:hypothetical protein
VKVIVVGADGFIEQKSEVIRELIEPRFSISPEFLMETISTTY